MATSARAEHQLSMQHPDRHTVIKKKSPKQTRAVKTKSKQVRETGWRKAIQVAASRRNTETVARAISSPNLMDSYLAAFLSDTKLPDKYAGAIAHFFEGTQQQLSYSLIARWRRGRPAIPDDAVGIMLATALRWALTKRLGVSLSERDILWISERLYPSIISSGLLLPQLLKAALVERTRAGVLSENNFRWAARAVMRAEA